MLISRARSVAGAALLLTSLLASGAQAGGPAEDQAAADALFHEGRALIKQGKYADACPKLAASQKLDPATGTLLALADCYELNGQTASAWATFNETGSAARKASDVKRADEAARRVAALEPRLSRLTIEVPADSRAPHFELRRNGKVIDAALFGSAVPVDPGEQTIEVTAEGKLPWRSTVRIEPKPGTTSVRVPPLAPAPAAAPGPRPAAEAPRAPVENATPPSGWSTQRTVGLVVGGVGLVGVALGTVFGVQTLSKISEVKSSNACTTDSPPRCNQQGYDLEQDAGKTANISNAAFAVGGAALIAGVVIFVTAPSSKGKKAGGLPLTISPTLGAGSQGLTLKGAF